MPSASIPSTPSLILLCHIVSAATRAGGEPTCEGPRKDDSDGGDGCRIVALRSWRDFPVAGNLWVGEPL
jgi:hypothetical protein